MEKRYLRLTIGLCIQRMANLSSLGSAIHSGGRRVRSSIPTRSSLAAYWSVWQHSQLSEGHGSVEETNRGEALSFCLVLSGVINPFFVEFYGPFSLDGPVTSPTGRIPIEDGDACSSIPPRKSCIDKAIRGGFCSGKYIPCVSVRCRRKEWFFCLDDSFGANTVVPYSTNADYASLCAKRVSWSTSR